MYCLFLFITADARKSNINILLLARTKNRQKIRKSIQVVYIDGTVFVQAAQKNSLKRFGPTRIREN